MTEIAVVILNWNGLKLLQEFLPIVIKNSEGIDIVVVDNCSSDTSVDYVRINFPIVKLVILDKNYGFAGGYNRALAELKYQYYILLNSDAAPEKGWVQPLLDTLKSSVSVAVSVPKIKNYRNPSAFEYAGAAGGFIDFLGYPFCRGRVFDTVETDFGQYDDPLKVFWASGAAFAIKAKIFLDSGGFDEDFFAHQEEIDLCWRINNLGFDVLYVPDSAVYHLGGATLNSSNPRKTYLNFRNNLFMILKNHKRDGLFRVVLMRMILDGVAAFRFLLKAEFGDFWAVFKAHLQFYIGFYRFYKKRKASASEVLQNDSLIYKKSLVWQFFLKRKTTFRELQWLKEGQ